MDRTSGIGGTDIAAILGLSPWKTPLQVWLEKTGREVAEPDEAAKERMQWGLRLEDVIAQHYAERHAAQVVRIHATMRRPDMPIVMGHIDRAICHDGVEAQWIAESGVLTGARSILEIKTAGADALRSGEWGEEGTDIVPRHYWLQVQWYLGITRVELGEIAVLFGGQRYREYALRLEDDLFREIAAFAAQWWETHVVGGVAPPPTSAADVLRLYPRDAGTAIEASPDIIEACREAGRLRRELDALTSRYESVTDQIKIAMGEAAELRANGRVLATWKATKPQWHVDWKAIASAMNPPKELIDQHTSAAQPVRRFLLKEDKHE